MYTYFQSLIKNIILKFWSDSFFSYEKKGLYNFWPHLSKEKQKTNTVPKSNFFTDSGSDHKISITASFSLKWLPKGQKCKFSKIEENLVWIFSPIPNLTLRFCTKGFYSAKNAILFRSTSKISENRVSFINRICTYLRFWPQKLDKSLC